MSDKPEDQSATAAPDADKKRVAKEQRVTQRQQERRTERMNARRAERQAARRKNQVTAKP